MPEIANISHKHEAIMQYMIANPAAKLGDVAREFGVSQPWLSCIIHSNIFKSKLRERQEGAFGELASTITEKLEAIAHAALDNMHEHVLASQGNLGANLEVADKVLHRLGYAPSKVAAPAAPGGTTVNVFQVSQSDLAQARQFIGLQQQQPAALEHNSDPHSQGSVGGALLADAATVPSQD